MYSIYTYIHIDRMIERKAGYMWHEQHYMCEQHMHISISIYIYSILYIHKDIIILNGSSSKSSGINGC